MAQDLTGLKIRTERKRYRLTQRELAERAGISASYLNLIELNKRPVAPSMLTRIADGLGVPATALDGASERRVAENLNEVSADPRIADGLAHPGPAEELVGRHAGWADLIVKLYQSYLDERQAVLALADRLNRDPFLGESVHRILTDVTAIRSAAEILHGADKLGNDDRNRFISIVASGSERLSATAQSLVAFFDNAAMRVRSATPMEYVDAFIFEADNHFPVLEELASDFLNSRAGYRNSAAPDASSIDRGEHAAAATALTEAPETRRFRHVRGIAQAIAGQIVGAIVENNASLASAEARELAAAALYGYVAGAILMPYDRFRAAAEQERYDIDRLSRLFDVSYEQAAHRLATLRRPDTEGVRFAFMRSDPSGYVTKRLPLPHLPLPRYANACPMWPIHHAFQSPGTTVRSFGRLPSGESFLFFARAVDKRAPSTNGPRNLLSVMLACPASYADRVVYGDGLDRAQAMLPVGTVCRLCPRADCGYRQEAPLIA